MPSWLRADQSEKCLQGGILSQLEALRYPSCTSLVMSLIVKFALIARDGTAAIIASQAGAGAWEPC